MMPLADFTFRLGDDGLLLNDDSSSFPFVDITRVIGLDSTPYRETIRDHEGMDGGFIDAEFEKGREIILEGTIYGENGNLETYLDSLKANFEPVQTPIPLYIKSRGVDERLVFVKPRGVRYDWDMAMRLSQTNAQFLMYAEDPRIYSTTIQSQTIPSGALITSGIGFSLAFNFGFGGVTDTTDGQFVTNGGNRPTPAVMVIQGPALNPVIINDTTSSTMKFNINLAASDTLTIDLGNRTVRLNDSANRRNVLQAPEWFLLQKGNNFIRYRTESPYAITVVTDTFTRTVSPGLGTTDSGDTYTLSPVSTDFSTNGSTGQMSLGSVDVSRLALLSETMIDTEVLWQFTVPVLLTGGPLKMFTKVRQVDSNNYYLLGVGINPDNTFSALPFKAVGGVISFVTGGAQVTIPGITHSAGTTYKLRVRIVGPNIMYRVWPALSAEPVNWSVNYVDTSITGSGNVGIEGKLDITNTNTLPMSITFDNLTIVNLRGGSTILLSYRSAWR